MRGGVRGLLSAQVRSNYKLAKNCAKTLIAHAARKGKPLSGLSP